MDRNTPVEGKSFPSTDWDMIRRASRRDGSPQTQALNQWLERYHPALVAYLICGKRIASDRAEELVQEFLLQKVLTGPLLERAEERRGKCFRSYLKTSLDNFVIDASRRDQAQCRSPGVLLSLDHAEGIDVADAPDPQAAVFDLSWALQVLAEAIQAVCVECRQKERGDLWGLFDGRILSVVCGRMPPSFQDLAGRFGFASEKQVSNALRTAQRMFQRNLEAILAEVVGGEKVEEEKKALQEILGSAGAAWVDALRKQLGMDLPEVSWATADTGRADPCLLVGMIDLGADASTDLQEAFDNALAVPLLLVVTPVDAAQAGSLKAWVENEGAEVRNLGDLLRCPEVPVELVNLVKQHAKRCRREETVPSRVGMALYYASIAVALVRCGERISKHEDQALRDGFQWVADQPWVEETMRELCREAYTRLGGGGGLSE
jgi:DNA-directed RNA polymerase specialized sigma24 family protein